MKAMVAKEPGVAEYIEVPTPVPADDQALLKIHRNGICATDLEILSGAAGFMHDGSTSYPVRFGHEYSAEVVAVGKDVTEVKVGDHVIGEGGVPCKHCPECLAGNYNACRNIMGVGTLRTWPGSYAEYMVMPADCLYVLPDSISHDVASLLEPAAIGMNGVNKADIVPGETIVLVTGVGAIGLAAAAFAKHRGAKKVIVSGRTPYKLELAKKMGADMVVNPKEEDLVDVLMKETDGHGVDCIIECSGSVAVLDDCVEVLAKQGKLILISLYGKKYTNFDIDAFIFKEADMRTVMFHDTLDTIKAVDEGVDLSPLITRHIRFDEAAEFMMDLIKQERKENVKVMVDFD